MAMSNCRVVGFALLLAGGSVAQADSGPNSRPARAASPLLVGQAAGEPSVEPAMRPPPVSADDRRAVRGIIEAQLKAFASANAERAFSFAAPGIREQVSDAASFMTMVRNNYPMLIHPEAISFFEPERTGNLIAQAVQFRDREGKLWRAAYQLERQADWQWRINGCVVIRDRTSTAV